jgi:hypothetical protein
VKQKYLGPVQRGFKVAVNAYRAGFNILTWRQFGTSFWVLMFAIGGLVVSYLFPFQWAAYAAIVKFIGPQNIYLSHKRFRKMVADNEQEVKAKMEVQRLKRQGSVDTGIGRSDGSGVSLTALAGGEEPASVAAAALVAAEKKPPASRYQQYSSVSSREPARCLSRFLAPFLPLSFHPRFTPFLSHSSHPRFTRPPHIPPLPPAQLFYKKFSSISARLPTSKPTSAKTSKGLVVNVPCRNALSTRRLYDDCNLVDFGKLREMRGRAARQQGEGGSVRSVGSARSRGSDGGKKDR